MTNSTYNGGVAKQFGNFSFSRVFEAGHTVSAYQPETVYRIFMRTMFSQDVPTGQVNVTTGYLTKGPLDSWSWKNTLPAESPTTCMVEGSFQDVDVWGALG